MFSGFTKRMTELKKKIDADDAAAEAKKANSTAHVQACPGICCFYL